ncbi:pentapeptide repeat-containing protein [Pseudomonas sp. GL93]|uniref:pentapeptide repeat-containing protein n=1 Tax=Pseudomonas sp. GL93 TaxID=2014741 RepID=UPI0015B3DFA6|nr:pentapeptide repeat-containing protein [Pseudomonas sp. GL93]
MIDCKLKNAKLSDPIFDQCVLESCNFREASLKDCEFSNCAFTQCKIIDNSFNASKTANVTFSGKLQEVSFISEPPNTPLLIDFELCKLDWVTFIDCDLEQIIPPADPQHIFFKDVSVRARKALALIISEPENSINKLLKRRLQKLTTQRGALFNIKNLEEYQGPELTKQFIALLQNT